MWILALHPWYQRYSWEARGYSLVLALLPVTLVARRRGLLTGKWLWWSLLGIVQFALVWTYTKNQKVVDLSGERFW